MKKVDKYIMKRCKSVIVPYSDISAEAFCLLCHNSIKKVEHSDKQDTGDCREVQILISKEAWSLFKGMGMDFLDESTIKEIDETGIYGRLWGASIKVIDKLEHVIFIGEEIEDFEFETDAVKLIDKENLNKDGC